MEELKKSKSERLHFNRDSLLEKLGGKREYFLEVLGMVEKGTILADLQEIKSSIEKREGVDNARSHAHRIKGSASGASLEILSDLAAELEKLEPWDWNTAQSYLEKLNAEMDTISSIIQDEKA